MNISRVIAIGIAWAASILGVGLWAQSGTQKPPVLVQPGEPHGEIITGENIGFQRVAGELPDRDGRITGRIVVKINGKWVETAPPVRMVR